MQPRRILHVSAARTRTWAFEAQEIWGPGAVAAGSPCLGVPAWEPSVVVELPAGTGIDCIDP